MLQKMSQEGSLNVMPSASDDGFIRTLDRSQFKKQVVVQAFRVPTKNIAVMNKKLKG